MNVSKALSFIEKHGILLVFPIDNRKDPLSLWSSFHPRSEMRWEWDSDGDNRVADLWRLREQLSRSGKVVYTKWFRGRATFFSREIFVAMLAALGSSRDTRTGALSDLSPPAREILGILQSDSPLSTKELKRASGLQGKLHERAYEHALKALWSRLLIVGYGERDDGAFPSLLVGASQLLFEELWSESIEMAPKEGRDRVEARVQEASPFLKQFLKQISGT